MGPSLLETEHMAGSKYIKAKLTPEFDNKTSGLGNLGLLRKNKNPVVTSVDNIKETKVWKLPG